MNAGALIFMLSAYGFVLGLTIWCFARLMKADPAHEYLPPPGTSL